LLHCRLRLAGHANRSSSGGGSGDGALRRRKRLMQGRHMSSERRKRWCCSWFGRGSGRSRQQQALLSAMVPRWRARLAERDGAEGEHWGDCGVRERARAPSLWATGAQGSCPWRWSRECCMAATSWPRVGHWSISTNRWRATEWPVWETNLGHFYAELGDGPNMKFVKLGLIYICYLRVTAIRVVDQ